MSPMSKRLYVILIVILLGGLAIIFDLSLKGRIALTYTEVNDLRGLDVFLASPRDDMRALKINGHLIEVGRRRALQILPGYPDVLYMVRPYRQVYEQPLNMTRAELYDLCINLSGESLEEVKQKAAEGAFLPLWKGRVENKEVCIYKASQFIYVLTGVKDKPMHIAQVELADYMGMPPQDILSHIIPDQLQWAGGLIGYRTTPFPYTYQLDIPDALMRWLKKTASSID